MVCILSLLGKQYIPRNLNEKKEDNLIEDLIR